jgi:hypothetical protein
MDTVDALESDHVGGITSTRVDRMPQRPLDRVIFMRRGWAKAHDDFALFASFAVKYSG